MICIDSITVYPKKLTVKVGSLYRSTYTEVHPSCADCNCVTWHSENPEIAAVDAINGDIYGVGAGTTRIYATAVDGIGCSDFVTVTVN